MQDGKMRRRSFPLCERAAGVHAALPGMDEELTGSLWVRIKERTGKRDIIVGVCYRPPDQEE